MKKKKFLFLLQEGKIKSKIKKTKAQAMTVEPHRRV
jgi:hypothetical protein